MSDLERQVERGSLFTHTALSDIAQRGYETESVLLGLVDILIARGLVDEGSLGDAAAAARAGLEQRGETVSPGISLRIDPPDADDGVAEVDCAARMHVCKAVCCKLGFALSAAEIEAGDVRWDLGAPYLIRREQDGYCTHCDRTTGACGVYADRPRICRGYSCVGDERIWKDFDGMVLNQEWIDEHLVESRPALTATAMVPVETLVESARGGAGEGPGETGGATL